MFPAAPLDRKPLLPPEVQALLPAWRSTENEEDPIARVKITLPDAGWIWYVVEFDGKDRCFGLVIGADVEAGYFSLSEIASLHEDLAREGVTIRPAERDGQFTPAPLSELTRLHSQHDAGVPWTPQP